MPDVQPPSRHAAARVGRGGRHMALRDQEIYEPKPSRRVPIALGAAAVVVVLGAGAAFAVTGGAGVLPVFTAAEPSARVPGEAHSPSRTPRYKIGQETPRPSPTRPDTERGRKAATKADAKGGTEPTTSATRSERSAGAGGSGGSGSGGSGAESESEASSKQGDLTGTGAKAFVVDFLDALDHGNRTGDYGIAGYLSRDCNSSACISWRVRDAQLRSRTLGEFEPVIEGRSCNARIAVAFETSGGTSTRTYEIELTYASGQWHVADLK